MIEKIKKEVLNNKKRWTEELNIILDFYNSCNELIEKLIVKKNNLIQCPFKQSTDDIKFYHSVLKDSIFYYSNSLNVRKKKLINDISNFYLFFNQNRIRLNNINADIFHLLMKDYVDYSNVENTSNYSWIKDDKSYKLDNWESDVNYILKYHIYIIGNFFNILKMEFTFFDEVAIDEDIYKYANVTTSETSSGKSCFPCFSFRSRNEVKEDLIKFQEIREQLDKEYVKLNKDKVNLELRKNKFLKEKKNLKAKMKELEEQKKQFIKDKDELEDLKEEKKDNIFVVDKQDDLDLDGVIGYSSDSINKQIDSDYNKDLGKESEEN